MKTNRNDIYTSGQVAKICRVAPRTVAKWADTGVLKCYRLPTPGRDRRFRREHLLDFIRMSELDVDLPDEMRPRRVLLVGLDGRFREQLESLLAKVFEDANRHETFASRDLFNAGVTVGKVWPDIVVLDFSLGRQAAIDAAERLRCDLAEKQPVLIAMANEDEDRLGSLSVHFDGVLKHPVSAGQLCDLIEEKSGHLLDV